MRLSRLLLFAVASLCSIVHSARDEFSLVYVGPPSDGTLQAEREEAKADQHKGQDQTPDPDDESEQSPGRHGRKKRSGASLDAGTDALLGPNQRARKKRSAANDTSQCSCIPCGEMEHSDATLPVCAVARDDCDAESGDGASDCYTDADVPCDCWSGSTCADAAGYWVSSFESRDAIGVQNGCVAVFSSVNHTYDAYSGSLRGDQITAAGWKATVEKNDIQWASGEVWTRQEGTSANRNCPCVDVDPDSVGEPTPEFIYTTVAGIVVSLPRHYGSYCRAWDNIIHPNCTREHNRSDFCDQRWCFVDPCQCDLDVKPIQARMFSGSEYKGGPVSYSYRTCGSQDLFSKRMGRSCHAWTDLPSCLEVGCVWDPENKVCSTKSSASVCANKLAMKATIAYVEQLSDKLNADKPPSTTARSSFIENGGFAYRKASASTPHVLRALTTVHVETPLQMGGCKEFAEDVPHWYPVGAPFIRSVGVKHFAWIKPCENVRFGGLAFKLSSNNVYLFPFFSPADQCGSTRGLDTVQVSIIKGEVRNLGLSSAFTNVELADPNRSSEAWNIHKEQRLVKTRGLTPEQYWQKYLGLPEGDDTITFSYPGGFQGTCSFSNCKLYAKRYDEDTGFWRQCQSECCGKARSKNLRRMATNVSALEEMRFFNEICGWKSSGEANVTPRGRRIGLIFLVGTLLFLPVVFSVFAVGEYDDPVADRARTDKTTGTAPVQGALHTGTEESGSLAASQEPKYWGWTLMFNDPHHEERYVADCARRICTHSSPGFVVGIFTSVKQMFWVKTPDRSSIFVGNPFTISDPFFVKATAWLCIGSTSFILLVLCSLSGRAKRSPYTELVVVLWAILITPMVFGFGDSFDVAAYFGVEPQKEFQTYIFDSEKIIYMMMLMVWLCLFTSIRFVALFPLAVFIVFWYPFQAIFFGSPDELFLWPMVFGGNANQMESMMSFISQDLWSKPPVIMSYSGLLAFVVFFLLLGQRTIEITRRETFLSLLLSADLIKSLAKETDKVEDHSNALEEVTSSLQQVSEGMQTVQDHPAIKKAGLVNELRHLSSLLDSARKQLSSADRLFEVDAKSYLQNSKFKDLQINDELQDFFMGGTEHVPDAVDQLGSAARRASLTRGGPVAGGALTATMELMEKEAAEQTEGFGEIWSFSALQLALDTGQRALLFVAEAAIVKAPWAEDLLCPGVAEVGVMRNFIREVYKRYQPNSYHNEAHAAAVTHIACWFARQTGFMAEGVATALEQCALMFSAICHDVGHFGRNTNFLVNAKHSCSMIWNDNAPLENMHTAVAFSLTEQADCNIFAQLDKQERKSFRQQVIALILATDMKAHQESMTKFGTRRSADDFLKFAPRNGASGGEAATKEDKERWTADKAMLAKQILQCSDVGHAGCVWDQHREWSFRVTLEFFQQGDQEKELGLPVSPLCERNGFKIAGGQGFFIEVMAKPGFEHLEAAAISSQGKERIQEDVLKQCDINKAKWQEEFGKEGQFNPINHSEAAWQAPGAASRMPYHYEGQLAMVDTPDVIREVVALRGPGAEGI